MVWGLFSLSAFLALSAPVATFIWMLANERIVSPVGSDQDGPVVKYVTLHAYSPELFAIGSALSLVVASRKISTKTKKVDEEKTAEPGATDNPDDAQRLREDH